MVLFEVFAGLNTVDIMEFPEKFCIPDNYRFESSEVWCSKLGIVSSPELTILYASTGQVAHMSPSVAPLLAALAAGLRHAGAYGAPARHPAAPTSRSPGPSLEAGAIGTKSVGAAAPGVRFGGGSRWSQHHGAQAHAAYGRSRAASTYCGTSRALQVSGSGPTCEPDLCSQHHEARGQCRAAMDEMRQPREHGDGAEDDPRQDDRVEFSVGASEAELCDTTTAEGREGGSKENVDRPRVQFGRTTTRAFVIDEFPTEKDTVSGSSGSLANTCAEHSRGVLRRSGLGHRDGWVAADEEGCRGLREGDGQS